MTKGRVATAVAAAIAFMFVAQTAFAQYPIPRGSLYCAGSQLVVNTGGTATFTATLRDLAGNPMPGQTGFFDIVSQNGAASLSTPVSTTDFTGTAGTSLFVDGAVGTIFVRAVNDGLECRALLNVIQPPPPPTFNIITPPPVINIIETPPLINIVSVIRPPSTGDAGLASTNQGSGYDILAGSVGVSVLLIVSIVLMLRHQDHRSPVTNHEGN